MNTNNLPEVTIYTDGACLGNPGPGGWAAVLHFKNNKKEIVGGNTGTTNNRMELKAVILALKSLPQSYKVTIFTDSKYLHDALVKGWLIRWQKNGWQTSSKTAVKNQDLWKELIPLLKKHQITMKWVKGHNGQPDNERCDLLAKKEAKKGNYPLDSGTLN